MDRFYDGKPTKPKNLRQSGIFRDTDGRIPRLYPRAECESEVCYEDRRTAFDDRTVRHGDDLRPTVVRDRSTQLAGREGRGRAA